MGTPKRPFVDRHVPIALVLVSIVLALFIGTVGGAGAVPNSDRSVAVIPALTTVGLAANASWNGVNITTATSPSSAFHISFNGAVNIYYSWRQPGSASPWSINDARLQIFYFGFALATRDITQSVGGTSGNLTMGNWNTGALEYILEGSYLLKASLIATNGTTAWSQSFWVNVAAPFSILAALPIILILIAIYEVYELLTSGKRAVPKKPKKDVPPPKAPVTEPTPAAQEPTDPGSAAAPPGGGAS
ncbi:MAG: hypothetical protein WA547_04195 [Thermoplasmata archaeon]